MKHWLLILPGALIAACGGSGDDEDSFEDPRDGNIGWVEIREPIIGSGTYTTIASSIKIAGKAFVSPADTECIAVTPVQLALAWRNDSTGQRGQGGIVSFCQNTFLGVQWVTNWTIREGEIDLQFGDNVIAITAADNAGNSGTATITVVREKDRVAPVIVRTSPARDAIDVPASQAITSGSWPTTRGSWPPRWSSCPRWMP